MENKVSMRLKDRPEFYNKPQPITFLKTDKVHKAISVMAEKNYGSVVITDENNKVIGIVTERDVLKKLVLEGLSPKNTNLEKIMTKNPRVANENDSVIEWLRIMSNDRFRRLPVVDQEGKIKVIFTQGDFVSYTWPDLIFQASQMAKASFIGGYSVYGLLGMILIYSLVIIMALSYFT